MLTPGGQPMNPFGELVPALPVRILTQQGECRPCRCGLLHNEGKQRPSYWCGFLQWSDWSRSLAQGHSPSRTAATSSPKIRLGPQKQIAQPAAARRLQGTNGCSHGGEVDSWRRRRSLRSTDDTIGEKNMRKRFRDAGVSLRVVRDREADEGRIRRRLVQMASAAPVQRVYT